MEMLCLLVVWVASVLTRRCSDICWSVCAVHLWRYRGGYPALTECLQKLNKNKVDCELFHNLFLAKEKADILSVTYTDLSFVSTLQDFIKPEQ